jgi:excisionase family DNA binding protein
MAASSRIPLTTIRTERARPRANREPLGFAAIVVSRSERTICMSNTWFNVTEAAEHCRISRSTLYQKIKEGRIRARKIGKRTLLSRVELDRMIEDGAVTEVGGTLA